MTEGIQCKMGYDGHTLWKSHCEQIQEESIDFCLQHLPEFMLLQAREDLSFHRVTTVFLWEAAGSLWTQSETHPCVAPEATTAFSADCKPFSPLPFCASFSSFCETDQLSEGKFSTSLLKCHNESVSVKAKHHYLQPKNVLLQTVQPLPSNSVQKDSSEKKCLS